VGISVNTAYDGAVIIIVINIVAIVMSILVKKYANGDFVTIMLIISIVRITLISSNAL
jgi:hypothetical protein